MGLGQPKIHWLVWSQGKMGPGAKSGQELKCSPKLNKGQAWDNNDQTQAQSRAYISI